LKTTNIIPTGEQPAVPVAENLDTLKVLAGRIHKTPKTVSAWVKTGRIPAMKIGRNLLFDWGQVRAALQRYTINGNGGGL
jgi:hypothetical protein